MNFVVGNTKLHESYGFSCQPCLFDLERSADRERSGELWHSANYATGHRGFESRVFYEVQEGMTLAQAEQLYQQVYEKISEVVCASCRLTILWPTGCCILPG